MNKKATTTAAAAAAAATTKLTAWAVAVVVVPYFWTAWLPLVMMITMTMRKTHAFSAPPAILPKQAAIITHRFLVVARRQRTADTVRFQNEKHDNYNVNRYNYNHVLVSSRPCMTSTVLFGGSSSNSQNKDQDEIPSSWPLSSSLSSPSVSSFCWNPNLRRIMGVISSAGAIETAYLTYSKFFEKSTFCGGGGGGGDCNSVLQGPYSVIPGTNLPLALLGFLAYVTVACLAMVPLVKQKEQENTYPKIITMSTTNDEKEAEINNRLLLTAVCTAMGVFSVFLMTLLFGVLHEFCAFCVASAVFSITLANLSWLGGAVPSGQIKQGIQWSVNSTGAAALVASAVLFFAVPPSSLTISDDATSFSGTTSTTQLLASTGTIATATTAAVGKPPPPITTTSSPRSLAIASDLEALNARMFGAYWCSHCFDQKERLGKEAMAKVPYIECSKEGRNQQNALCKERNVPGYPTWEINGQLFPGEKELDELEDIIKSFNE